MTKDYSQIHSKTENRIENLLFNAQKEMIQLKKKVEGWDMSIWTLTRVENLMVLKSVTNYYRVLSKYYSDGGEKDGLQDLINEWMTLVGRFKEDCIRIPENKVETLKLKAQKEVIKSIGFEIYCWAKEMQKFDPTTNGDWLLPEVREAVDFASMLI